MKERSSNFELLRIISIYMIVLYHMYLHSMWGGISSVPLCLSKVLTIGLSSWGIVGVDCFVLISSYFLIDSKFKIMRIIRLILCMVFYQFSFLLITQWPTIELSSVCKALLVPILSDYWFATAYILLLLVTPFLNKLINVLNVSGLKKISAVLTCIVLFYHTMYPSASIGKWAIFICLYFIAAYLKRSNAIHRINTRSNLKYLAFSLLLSFILFLIFDNYNYIGPIRHFHSSIIAKYSPLAAFISIITFLMFMRINFKSTVVNYLSKGVLGVYIISENDYLHDFIYNETFAFYVSDNWSHTLFYLISYSITIMIVCVGIELVRIFVFKYIEEVIARTKCIYSIDNWFNKI